MLKIQNLKVRVLKPSVVKPADNFIIKGIDLLVDAGEVHVVMGPNGSGKSTLAQAIAGSPFYKADGKIVFGSKDISKMSPDKRAKLGIFLGFQNPVEIPGVAVFNVLRKASGTNGQKTNAKSVGQFRQELLEYASSLHLSDDHLKRAFNEGFSGGEKKRNEILQMMVLSPKLVILDEIDSGLDVDGLKTVAKSIAKFKKQNPKSSIILITHYARILKYLKADFVHVMSGGKIVKSGKQKLAHEIENKGYEVIGKEGHFV